MAVETDLDNSGMCRTGPMFKVVCLRFDPFLDCGTSSACCMCMQCHRRNYGGSSRDSRRALQHAQLFAWSIDRIERCIG